MRRVEHERERNQIRSDNNNRGKSIDDQKKRRYKLYNTFIMATIYVRRANHNNNNNKLLAHAARKMLSTINLKRHSLDGCVRSYYYYYWEWKMANVAMLFYCYEFQCLRTIYDANNDRRMLKLFYLSSNATPHNIAIVLL